MNKKGRGMFSLIFLLLALTIGAAMMQGDITIDQVNILKENFANNISEINVSIPEYPELQNALNYYVNGMLKAMIELAKWTMDFAANNPQVPYKALLYLIILGFLAPVLIVLFKLLIIIFLLVKEYYQSRKERKELKRYKK